MVRKLRVAVDDVDDNGRLHKLVQRNGRGQGELDRVVELGLHNLVGRDPAVRTRGTNTHTSKPTHGKKPGTVTAASSRFCHRWASGLSRQQHTVTQLLHDKATHSRGAQRWKQTNPADLNTQENTPPRT